MLPRSRFDADFGKSRKRVKDRHGGGQRRGFRRKVHFRDPDRTHVMKRKRRKCLVLLLRAGKLFCK